MTSLDLSLILTSTVIAGAPVAAAQPAGPRFESVPTLSLTTGAPARQISLADSLAADETLAVVEMAPGSDALPDGMTLSADGVLSGVPTTWLHAPRTVVLRASNAEGHTDVPLTLETRAIAPLSIRNRTPEVNFGPSSNATYVSAGGPLRVTIPSGQTFNGVLWREPLIPGETYALTATVTRGTATGNIRVRAGETNRSGLALIHDPAPAPYPLDLLAANPASLVATTPQTFVAPAATGGVGVIFSGAAGQNVIVDAIALAPVSGRAIEDWVARYHPPQADAPTLGAVSDVVVQRGVTADVNLSGHALNATRLALSPDSEPLPPGLALAGMRLVGTPADYATRAIRVRALNDADDFVTAAFDVRVADVLPTLRSAAPAWPATLPIAPFDVAARFTGFAAPIDRIDLLAEGAPLPDGLIYDDVTRTISGAPVALSPAEGDLLRFRAVAGDQVRTLELRVYAVPPVVSAVTSGNALLAVSGGATLTGLTGGSDATGWTLECTAIGANDDRRIRRTYSAPAGATMEMRLRIVRQTGGFEALTSYTGSGSTGAADHNWSAPAAGQPEVYYQTIVRTFTAPATGQEVGIEFKSLNLGDRFFIAEFSILNVADQRVYDAQRNFDEGLPLGAPVAIGTGDRFVNATSYSLSGSVPGMVFDTTSGLLNGAPTTAGTYALTVTGATGANTLARTFNVTVAEGQFSYPGDIFGPKSVDADSILGVVSSVLRTGQDTWRVSRRKGPKIRALQRLWGLTRGGRYTIAIPTARGSLPGATVIRAWATVHTDIDNAAYNPGHVFSGKVLLGEWLASSGGLAAAEFAAPDNAPWIIVEAAASGSEFFELGRIAVAAVAGDGPVAGGGWRVDQADGAKARLFNLEHGRRYRLASTGATALSVSRAADLSAPTDQGTGATLDFIAQSEILWVGYNGATPTLTDIQGTAWHTLSAAAAPAQEAGARWPFLHVHPAAPSGTAVTPATLPAALAAATGGETFVLANGIYADITLTGRRFTAPVTLIAAEHLGAQIGRITLSDVRRLAIRGLRVTGGIQIAQTQDVVIRNNLFTGAYGSNITITTPSSGNGEHFGLEIVSNDFIGTPGTDQNFYQNNPQGKVITIFNVYHSRIAGNRFVGYREDAIVFGGMRTLFDHNLIGESYSARERDPVTGATRSDHADAMQFQMPFLRHNSWLTMTRNVVADNIAGVSGFAVLHGLWSGNQPAGHMFIRAEQNAVHSQNDQWGLSHADVTLGYEVIDNTLFGRAPVGLGAQKWMGWSAGRIERNVARSVGGSLLTRRADNISWGGGAFDSDRNPINVFQDDTTIYGLAFTSAFLTANPAAAGRGAQLLIAELAAEPVAPAALRAHDWTLESVGGGQARITLRRPPEGSDTRIIGWDVEINGVVSTVSLNPPTVMQATVTAAAGQTVRLRAKVGAAVASWSDAKIY